ncbi:hypothetical protein Hypma_003753 [Hypsizygus marmoreus]|uniref:Uncharacterized protein n=1 Tax=Hypsizygus marmoreus TaxID=39966 RepID=A0A369J1I8_HYPMA|nr:hypothetical protein Hypma_003753 [Hypsizygus marmoreus]
MPYKAGPLKPFPIVEDWSDSPTLAFKDQNLIFTDIELIVCRLKHTSPTSATEHLKQIIEELTQKGQCLPDLYIVSSSTHDCLDYIYISFTDPL